MRKLTTIEILEDDIADLSSEYIYKSLLASFITCFEMKDTNSPGFFKSVIKTVLDRKFMKIGELSALLGYNSFTISRWKAGKFYPNRHARSSILSDILKSLTNDYNKIESIKPMPVIENHAPITGSDNNIGGRPVTP